MRSPLKWFGGKGTMVKKILPLFPAHRTYVEAFGGGASLLFAKSPSLVEVYNDVDSDAVNLFRVLRDPESFARFRYLVAFTPYSREEFGECRETSRPIADPVERAARWFVVVRQSFGGRVGDTKPNWAFVREESARGMASSVMRWLGVIDSLPDVCARLMSVQIEHDDWRKVLSRYDSPETFFYLDPPYVLGERVNGGYKHELEDADHSDLVAAVQRLEGKVLLSGYANPLYSPLEGAGWNRIDFEVGCMSAGKGRARTRVAEGVVLAKARRIETVWANYPIRPAGL